MHLHWTRSNQGTRFMAMNKIVLLALCASSFGFSACESTKESLGLNRSAPDEFAVVKRAPLALPPEYALRPPAPGMARPQEKPTDQQAQVAVFGNENTRKTNVKSSGEDALLIAAGADAVKPDIRYTVDQESKDFGKESQPVIDKLMGLGGKDYTPPAETLNASEEAERLKNVDTKN